MSELTFSRNILKIYTNKCSNIFSLAGESVFNDIDGKIGIVYDDFDCKQDIIDNWKPYKLERIFTLANRRKTLHMDDKICFHKRMYDSVFTPESYLNINDISDISNNNNLYFVKNTQSTGGKGVNIYNYDTLKNINTNNCVIQKNIINPDLYNGSRYKIRQLILVYQQNIYLYKNNWFSSSNINYNKDNDTSSNNNLRDMHVISQKLDTEFNLVNKLDNYNKINENIKLAVIDFKKIYTKEIKTISGTEYAVLGFDIIVDNEKNVQIIEINHRSNYNHPKNVRTECDVNFFKDMILLLVNNTIYENNDLLLID